MGLTAQGIWFPGPDDPIAPLENLFAALATSVDDNMGVRHFATTADRDAAYALKPFKLCTVGTDVASGTLYKRTGSTWATL